MHRVLGGHSNSWTLAKHNGNKFQFQRVIQCLFLYKIHCNLVFKVLTLKRHFQGFFTTSDYLATYLNSVLGPTWTWHWWQSLLRPGDRYEDSDHYCLFQGQNYCLNLPVRMKMYLKTSSSMFENKYRFTFTDVSIKICEFSYTVKSYNKYNKTVRPVTKYFKYPALSHHISSFMACSLNFTAMHIDCFLSHT